MVTLVGRVVVLGADDGDPTASLVGQVLADAGAEVAVTASREAAAESVESEDVAVLVVVDGTTDLVAGLRSSDSPRQRHVSIAVVVSSADHADGALDAGADSVLIRPVEADRLVEAVTRLV